MHLPWGPVIAVLASAVVHARVLGADFIDDDFIYFYELKKLGTLPSILHPFGQHFMASFKLIVAVLQGTFGMHPRGYFALVLLTHLANVLLLYGVVRALGRSTTVATAAAFLWGSAPAFQSTLAWFSAYSHMLSTTTTLLALWMLARAVEKRRPPTAITLVGINLVLLIGSCTMLTGSVATILFPVVTLLLLPRDSAPGRSGLALLPASLITIAILAYCSTRGGHTWIKPINVLVVFPQLLAYGLGLVFAGPLVTVHNVEGAMGIFAHGSFAMAVMISAVPAVALLGVIVWRIRRGDNAERRVLLAMLMLACALYGAIAIGRSAMIPEGQTAWMATRDRYHYDANPALVIAVAVALARLRAPVPQIWARIAIALAIVAWTAVSWHLAPDELMTNRQAWSRDVMDLTDAAIRDIVHRAPGEDVVYIRNDDFRVDSLMVTMGSTYPEFPGIGAYWILAHGTAPVGTRPLRFFEADPKRLEAIRAETRSETAAMFVGLLSIKGGTEVRTIAKHAPFPISTYLTQTRDPQFGKGYHRLAEWARRDPAIAGAH